MDVAELSSSRIRGIEVIKTQRNLLLFELHRLLTYPRITSLKLMVDESLLSLLGNMFLPNPPRIDRLEDYPTGMED